MPKKKPLPKENDDTHTLTASEMAYVNALFEAGMNATSAYMKVYPNSSYSAARASSSRLLAKDNLRLEIKKRLELKSMGVEEALALTADIARGSHRAFLRYDDDGFPYFNLSDPSAQENLHIIKKIKSKRERRIEGSGKNTEEWEGEWVEVELYDAQAALRDILKMHGKFIEKVDVTSGGEKIENNAEITNRAISTLADAIREGLSGEGGK